MWRVQPRVSSAVTGNGGLGDLLRGRQFPDGRIFLPFLLYFLRWAPELLFLLHLPPQFGSCATTAHGFMRC